jgi:hypothetical protein
LGASCCKTKRFCRRLKDRCELRVPNACRKGFNGPSGHVEHLSAGLAEGQVRCQERGGPRKAAPHGAQHRTGGTCSSVTDGTLKHACLRDLTSALVGAQLEELHAKYKLSDGPEVSDLRKSKDRFLDSSLVRLDGARPAFGISTLRAPARMHCAGLARQPCSNTDRPGICSRRTAGSMLPARAMTRSSPTPPR